MITKYFSSDVDIQPGKVSEIQRIYFLSSQFHNQSHIESYILNRNVFVLACEGVLRGVAYLNENFFKQTCIEFLNIQEDFRHSGLGTLFLDFFIKHCSSEKLFALCNESNEGGKNILEKKSFTQSGFMYNIDPSSAQLLFVKNIRSVTKIKDVKEEFDLHKKFLVEKLVNQMQSKTLQYQSIFSTCPSPNQAAVQKTTGGFKW